MRLTIFKPGSRVVIGSIEAVVTKVQIEGDFHVTYECVWWDEVNRRCEWVEAFEVRASDESRSVDIGFKVG